MARLRLFANLREIAGASEVEVSGETVGAVLDEAATRYGDLFRRNLDRTKVWLNGDPADRGDPVAPGDEIALIPPVSGGQVRGTLTVSGIAVALATVALLVTNALAEPAWFVAALVGAGGLWAWDIAGEDDLWRPYRFPVMVAVLAGGLITYWFEVAELEGGGNGVGLGVAVAVAIIFSLGSAVVSARHRALISIVTTVTTATTAALAVGSLVLVRILQGQDLIWVFFAVVIVGKGTAAILARYQSPVLDPLTGSVLTTVAAGVVASFIWDIDLFALFLVSVLVAIGLVAGTTLGSIARVGEVYLTDPVEGSWVALDGPVIAATIFAPFINLLM